MMVLRDWLLSLCEGLSWFLFFYYLIYSIKYPVILWQSALILVFFVYIIGLFRPVIKFTDIWKTIWVFGK